MRTQLHVDPGCSYYGWMRVQLVRLYTVITKYGAYKGEEEEGEEKFDIGIKWRGKRDSLSPVEEGARYGRGG